MDFNTTSSEFLLCIGLPPDDHSLLSSAGFKISNTAQAKCCGQIWCAVKKLDKTAEKITEALHIPNGKVKCISDIFPKLKNAFTKPLDSHNEFPVALHLLVFDKTIDLSPITKFACSISYWTTEESCDENLPFSEFSDMPYIRKQLVSMSNVLSQKTNKIIPVLLFTGETGTGKSYAASFMSQAISHKPPLTINCASLDDEHIETTLFGTQGGMWTDIKDDVIGAFEAAGDGVLFLDEIGELPPTAQAHLLTVLQDRICRPFGPMTTRKRNDRNTPLTIPDPIPVRCKIIFGTNKDLSAEVAARRFRADLYHRINTLEITFPKISERFAGREYNGHGQYIRQSATDEKRRALDFIRRLRIKFCKELGGIKMSPGAIAAFQNACVQLSWPGNFRDINTLFTRLYVLSASENASNIIGQHMVESAIADIDLRTNGKQPETETPKTEKIDPPNHIPASVLTLACKGKTALQINTLKFVLDVAERSTTLKQAAQLCYAGTTNSSNVSSKYKALLEKFGLKFDPTAQGHISSMVASRAN